MKLISTVESILGNAIFSHNKVVRDESMKPIRRFQHYTESLKPPSTVLNTKFGDSRWHKWMGKMSSDDYQNSDNTEKQMALVDGKIEL